MVKTPIERQRSLEQRKKEAGLKEYRVWAPKTAEAEAELRKCAAKLVRKHERLRAVTLRNFDPEPKET
jgi:hypothetical protein